MENRKQKIKKIWLFAITIFVMMSCRNQTENGSVTDTLLQATDTAKIISVNNGKHCFAYIGDNDSVFLFLLIKKGTVTGKLIYHLYEKDENQGTINGRFHGDTLLANYVFFSEGKQSVRQVVFLRKGNVFQEGDGNMREENGEIVFSNPADVSFTNNIILSPINCNEFNAK